MRRLRKTKRSQPGRGSLALPAVVMSVLAGAFVVWFLIGAHEASSSADLTASAAMRAPVQPPQIATAPFPADARTPPPVPAPVTVVAPEPAQPVRATLTLELQPTQQILTPALMTAVVSAPEQISAPAAFAPPVAESSAARRPPMAYAAAAAAPPMPAPMQAIKLTPKPEAKPEPKPAPQAAPREEADEGTDKPLRSVFSIILAQTQTEGEARAKLGPLKQKFGALLGARRLSYHRVKEGGSFVWRVRSAGLSEDDATEICDKIESAGGDCSAAPQ